MHFAGIIYFSLGHFEAKTCGWPVIMCATSLDKSCIKNLAFFFFFSLAKALLHVIN